MGDMARPNTRPSGVEPGASCAVIQQIARDTGHLRLLVGCDGGRPSASGLTIDVGEPVYATLRLMPENHSHLAIVTKDDEVVGLITLDDVLRRLLPGEDVTTDCPV